MQKKNITKRGRETERKERVHLGMEVKHRTPRRLRIDSHVKLFVSVDCLKEISLSQTSSKNPKSKGKSVRKAIAPKRMKLIQCILDTQ